ncbi:MAG: hypothetical protein IJ680_03750 [Paludibacteraceae bacterium]|nr:hypothetical protein [Paludibacteraceae bacterium]
MHSGKKFWVLLLMMLSVRFVSADDVKFGWFAPCWTDDDAEKAQTMGYVLKRAADNSLYVMFDIGSHGDSLSTNFNERMEPDHFMGHEFWGPRYRGTGYNYNLAIIKFDASGKYLWSVQSTQGDVDVAHSVMEILPDGTLMLAVTARHTDTVAGLDERVLKLQGATGLADTLTYTLPFHYATNSTRGASRFYHSALIRIGRDGQILSGSPLIEHPDQHDTSVAEGGTTWNFIDLVTDGRSAYLLGRVYRPLTLGGVTIDPMPQGESLFLAKFDQQWNCQKYIVTSGITANSLNTALTFADDDHLYVATNTRNKPVPSTLYFGNASCQQADTTYSVYMARVDTTLGVDWLREVPGVIDAGQNSIQVKSIVVDNGQIYVSGGIQGGLQLPDTVLHNATGKYQNFILKASAADGMVQKAIIANNVNGINLSTAVLARDGLIYKYGYDFSGSPYTHGVEVYDDDLNAGPVYPLVTRGGFSVSGAAVFVDDTLVAIGRYYKNQKPVLTYAPASEAYSYKINTAYVAAHIMPALYRVRLSVDDAAHGFVTGSGVYEAGTIVEIAAHAADGWHFDHWSDGSTSVYRQITAEESISLTAYFAVGASIDEHRAADCIRLADRHLSIFGVHGRIDVFDMLGQCVARTTDNMEVDLQQGLYVVAFQGQAVKIIVE